MTSDSTQKTPVTYEIRTLGDIFNLPTMEQMKTCLDEIGRGMIQARGMNDLMLAAVEALGDTAPERAVEWPEVVKWTDDKKGHVTTRFVGNDKSDTLSVTTTKA